jgi:hypothetical protein
MHEPLAQSAGAEQLRPGPDLHCPSAPHVMPPEHVSLSSPSVTALHTPGDGTGPGVGGPGATLAD